MYTNVVKRIIDLLFSLITLIVVLPILVFISVLIVLVNKQYPLFFQQRPGKNGKIFKLIKFRTMRDIYDESGNQLPDKYRITKIGRFIRSASLDELPQLINVLKGDMSLIGPRPLLVKYLPLYSKEQARRHEVKPGITGWTQVNGRNALSWVEKFKLDVWYVDHVSFMLDLKIILLTVKKVLVREGINQSGQATTSAFKGND